MADPTSRRFDFATRRHSAAVFLAGLATRSCAAPQITRWPDRSKVHQRVEDGSICAGDRHVPGHETFRADPRQHAGVFGGKRVMIESPLIQELLAERMHKAIAKV